MKYFSVQGYIVSSCTPAMDHKAKTATYIGLPTTDPMVNPQVGMVEANHMFLGAAANGTAAPHFSASMCKKKNRKKRRGCFFFCCSHVELGDEDDKDKIFQYLESATNSDHHKGRFCVYMCCSNIELAPKTDHNGHAKM